jgi:hypothetical protein
VVLCTFGSLILKDSDKVQHTLMQELNLWIGTNFQKTKTTNVKKLIVIIVLAALPFLLVWAAFILTAFNFNPREVFNDGAFWGLSLMYWFLYVCLLGLIVDIIDEYKPTN